MKLEILVNGQSVDALSMMVHHDKAAVPGPGADREAEGAHPAPAL